MPRPDKHKALLPHLVDDHKEDLDRIYSQSIVQNLDLHAILHAGQKEVK